MNKNTIYDTPNQKNYETPVEGQTIQVLTQDEIDSLGLFVSQRNHRNIYEIPVEQDEVYIQFMAKKIFVRDTILNQINDPEFFFFVDEEETDDDVFVLPSGTIFRVVGGGIQVEHDIRLYDYFFFDNGRVFAIPDWETVEVMLVERQRTYTSVLIVEVFDFNNMRQSGEFLPSRAGEWIQTFAEKSGYNILMNLNVNADANTTGATVTIGQTPGITTLNTDSLV